MNRREVLRGMLAFSALGSMRAFPLELGQYSSQSTPAAKKLGIILQGPFGVVIRNYEGHRVTAFVPKTSKTDQAKHEFRSPSPYGEPLESGSSTYHLRLSQRGLRARWHSPTINRAFDDVKFSVKKWVADPDDYFVMLDLPNPDNITFIPPVYPALFESGQESAVRFGSAPLTQVLEYTIQELDYVRVTSLQCKNCGRIEDHHGPLSLKEMLEEYERYEHGTREQAETPSLSQRPQLSRWLGQYSHLYFFGVGLHPYMGEGPMPPDRAEHGINFFNNRLLPAIYQNQPIPPGSKLKKIGRDVLDCTTTQSEMPTRGLLRPAVWEPSAPHARLLTVSSPENCTAPGTVGTASSG